MAIEAAVEEPKSYLNEFAGVCFDASKSNRTSIASGKEVMILNWIFLNWRAKSKAWFMVVRAPAIASTSFASVK